MLEIRRFKDVMHHRRHDENKAMQVLLQWNVAQIDEFGDKPVMGNKRNLTVYNQGEMKDELVTVSKEAVSVSEKSTDSYQ